MRLIFRRPALVAAFSLLATASTAQTAAEDKQQTQATVEAYNQAYAEHLGVSIPEAVTYQVKIAEALRLDARLHSRSDYVGFRIAPGSTFRATYDFTGDAKAALASVTSDPAFQPRQVTNTPASIQQALQAVTAALKPFTQGHLLYFDDRTQKLMLHVPPGSPVRTLLATLKLAIPLEISEDGMVPQPTADLEGGRPVTSSTEGWTSGLSVVHSDGRRGITTAGHAPNTSLAFEGASVPFAGEIYGTRDLQWHSGSGHTYTPHVWIGPSSGYLTIQELTALPSGVPVCMQGNVNQNRCGRVDLTNATGTDANGRSFSNGVTFKRDDGTRMVSKGDSGAPLVTADGGVGRAHGVEFAGFDAISSVDFRGGIYVKVQDFSIMGVTAQTRPPY